MDAAHVERETLGSRVVDERHGAIDGREWTSHIAHLVSHAEVSAPVVDQALRWAAPLLGSVRSVLDLGCGPGVTSIQLAEAFPDASVVATDGTAELLEAAAERANAAGLQTRVTTSLQSMPDGIAELPQSDLVWASHVAHHLPDPVDALRQFGTRLTPHGLLVLREGGLSTRFLPDGELPGLLSRLDEVVELHRARHGNVTDVPRTATWPEMMRQAGLRHVATRSFLLDIPAPVSDDVRHFLVHRITMTLRFVGDVLTHADRAALLRLIDPDDPTSVLHRPDLYLLSAETIHVGAR
jgi:SAM-dependent methyltransferase